MTTLVQNGVTWLGSKLKTAAGVSITYTRGSYSVTITAACILNQYQIIDEEGFTTSVNSRDYLIHGAELILNGAAIAPRAGDRISETIGGVVNTFEVVPLGQLREYEPMDSDSVLLKVHTKKVA